MTEVMTQVELRSNGDEIVRYLEKVDLKSFVRNCAEIGVISENVKESSEYLDPAVPRPLCIRYLLLHACEQLEGNSRLSKSWFDLLTKHGVPRHLFKLEQSGHNVQNSHVSLQTMSLAEGIGEVLAGVEGGHVATGTKRPISELVFSEENISSLTEKLVECSCQWVNISINLNLPEHVRKSIKRRMHMHDNDKSCLNEVLREWVVGNHCNAKPPTLHNLLETLRSNTVGLGRIANLLQDYYIHEHFSIAPKRLCLEPSFLELVSQSPCALTIRDEKSTLLDVQVNKTNVFYQWCKDGFPLVEGGDFIGCNKPILCLNNSWVAEGAYVCKVAIEDDSTPAVCSECINVSVIVSPLKKVLVDRYCAQPEIPEDSWPPRSSNTYINLALIRQGNIEKAGEYARNTIQGDMDDVLANKDSIEYEDVFTDLESGTRLLIEGRPGSGKTTLVHKFSQDWGRGNCKLKLKNVRLLFLVHLRGFFNDPDITLRDIVQCYYTIECKNMVDEIMQLSVDHNGDGLCFILDGLDEYNPEPQRNLFIFQLIKRELLPKAVVIVASRPAATAKLRKVATKQIEVIGFMKEQISQYVEKYAFSEDVMSGDLLKYLNQHPNVHHMCYLPIHAAMVCYLFDVMVDKLPRTETAMYTKFTTYTLLRTLTREQKIDSLFSPENLPSLEKRSFQQICKLAFEKTATSKQVMKKSEIIDSIGNISSGNESMGLITVDCIASVCGFEDLYTFLHLTFQEYLAAYHISKLEEEKQLKVINDYCGEKHMSVVWKFYCGLVDFRKQEQNLKKIMSDKDDLFNVHCAFESQKTVTCNYVVRAAECGTLVFKNHFLTPSDMTAMGYVVRNSECPVEKVVLDKCKMGQEGVKALMDEASDKILSLKALSFHGKDCLMEQFRLLNTCLHNMVSIEVLDLSNTNLGSKKVKLLTENLKLPNLQVIKFSCSLFQKNIAIKEKHISHLRLLKFNSLKLRQVILVDGDIHEHKDIIISAFGLSPFLYGCGSTKSLLNLQDHPFELSELEILSNSIKRFSCCTNLILTNCNIGDNVGALKSLSLLESFDISVNSISDSGAITVAENIQHCTTLQNLNMSFNNIGDSGATAIAKKLIYLTKLRELNLSYNQIGDEGAIAIASATKDCDSIEILYLWNQRITEAGASTVSSLKADFELEVHVLNLTKTVLTAFDALRSSVSFDFTKIKFVNFKCLNDQEYIIKALAYLKQLKNIEKLNFNCCNFNMDGIKALADGLVHCTNLHTLNLGRNSINADGSKALADSLVHCTNLHTLDLGSNNIDTDGAKALADSLMHCTNLHTLDLGSNGIGTDGAKALADSLVHCTNLHTLDLGSNNIDNDGVKALADGLKHCTHLHTLNLNSNRIDAYGAKALADYLMHCTGLQKLDLSGNTIDIDFRSYNSTSDGIKVLADGLKHCIHLHTLNLSSILIGSEGAKALADSLMHCTNLHILDLSSNRIGTDGAKALADSLVHCTNLHTLDLGSNRIGTDGAKALADSLMHCTNLHTLDLGSNGIGTDGAKAFSDSLVHCTNLHTLDLGSNNIDTDGIKALADGLKHCTHLHTLNLNSNEIGVYGAKALADYLMHCTSLQKLDLGSNGIGTDGAKALADSLVHCTNLHTLDLGSNNIDNDGVKALADGLKHCTHLHTLNLNSNRIDAYGAKALADYLMHCTSLQKLDLSGNTIDIDFRSYNSTSDGIKVLADGLKHCIHLHTLNLSSILIGSEGAKALADSLMHCTNLHILDLSSNRIGTDGAKALADSLVHCTNLHTLDLGSNRIGTDGAKALADSLMHCTNLHTLDLGSNGIGTDGAKAFSDSLVHCTNLHTLDLGSNNIDTDGIKALADGLKHCTHLHTLNLNSNEIGVYGAKALADYLMHCTSLQKLDLGSNGIGTDGAKALADSLVHCTNLHTLDLGSNNIDNDGIKALADGLKHCTHLHTLNLNSNRIDAYGAKALADYLMHCTSLQKLDLSGNTIDIDFRSYNSTSDGIKVLADGLKHCTHLHTLNLNSNEIGVYGAKALADYLMHCTSLQKLDLGSNGIGTDGAKALADSLVHCTNLHTLDLGSNNIDNDGVKALADGLKHCTHLHTLNLNSNRIDAYGAKALADCLMHCTSLQKLDLSGNTVDIDFRSYNSTSDGIKALADGLKHCAHLHTLNLSSILIGSEGAKALADSLIHCTNLHILDLSSNWIGTDGAKALADCLMHCTNLHTLDLGGNGIGTDGAKALADSLMHCTNLHTLNLGSNIIDSDGAKALADSLIHCTNLCT